MTVTKRFLKMKQWQLFHNSWGNKQMDLASIKPRPCGTNKLFRQSTSGSQLCCHLLQGTSYMCKKCVYIHYITIYNQTAHTEKKQHELQLPYRWKGMTACWKRQHCLRHHQNHLRTTHRVKCGTMQAGTIQGSVQDRDNHLRHYIRPKQHVYGSC